MTGEIEKYSAHAVVLATGGYSNVFFLSTNAMNCNATAIWRAHKRGAYFANPCFTQIHPTCLPLHGESQSKLTLMSESLRNDGRVWVSMKKGDMRNPGDIPEDERDYYLERKYPSYGNLAFLPTTALLFLGVTLASWTRAGTLPRLYHRLLLLQAGATLGVFSATDSILFFLFWELSLVPFYFLVSLWGVGPQRV